MLYNITYIYIIEEVSLKRYRIMLLDFRQDATMVQWLANLF